MTRKKAGHEGDFFLYPHLLFEILCITVIVIEIVMILALALPSSVGREINFAFRFSPKPAWYFLPLYELVKYFPGKLLFLGASVLPLLLILTLYLVPWLDRSEEREIRRRPVAALAALLLGALLLFLLWQGWRI